MLNEKANYIFPYCGREKTLKQGIWSKEQATLQTQTSAECCSLGCLVLAVGL